ncbi:type II toxin-antitoxin system VapC family toxin [Planktothrix mougeotii]|uniref:DNA-binding protein n=1 Tax=Planktothrix mougeotii LEGE 06226 TaxID=1828728 RepID=A0ABR9UF36_9CYAN|nr:DNA-binding protein [Planktothrix mougeotii]MBE9144731.1 DNA-binding protein [Planktothrix mougeotii LEGE 06226]
MILVDTSAWFASVVPSDTDHQVATFWMCQNTQLLLTTDYVIDETLTLLRVRGHNSRAMALGEGLFTGKIATVYYLTEDDILLTWQVYSAILDREQS